MKLFLFGGAEIALKQADPLKKLIRETLVGLHVGSVLHVPFARLHPNEEDWKEGWFKETMKETGMEILDARNRFDIDKASGEAVFVNGGHGKKALMDMLNADKKLLHLVLNAKYYISESSGSMAVGQWLRCDQPGSILIGGLGILKNTIIEPHYSQRNLQALLVDEMKQVNAHYGVGIDCVTGLVAEASEFPDNWSKIGAGMVELKKLT